MQVLVTCFSILISCFAVNAANSLVKSEASFVPFVQRGFAHCSVSKDNLYLTVDQLKKAKELSLLGGQRALGLRFIVQCPKKKKIYAYIDSHIVRTLNETLIVFIKGKKIKKIEMIEFLEPREYRPSDLWIDQFKNKKLSKNLKTYGEIDGLTGATLSAKAITYSARRILALHEVIESEKKR
jgi:uncharacterized protein with FMN-binding domain